MQELCRANNALFVIDEVQTGVGATGSRWAYEGLALEPDVVAFAKKVQVGGLMAGRRVDDEPDNVFQVPGRISSTWGGGLVDMVRSTRILEVLERDNLVEHAAEMGELLVDALGGVASEHPGLVSNVRGRGLLCAVDLPTTEDRDTVVRKMREDGRVIVLSCGERSVRFRPSLVIQAQDVEEVVQALSRVVKNLEQAR